MVELMMVVLIVGILVAIAIALFAGNAKKAKATTCKANRRSLSDAIAAAALANNSTTEAEFSLTYNNDSGRYKCPAGGIYTYKQVDANRFDISCSVHGGDISGETKPDTGGGSTGGTGGSTGGSTGNTGGGSTGSTGGGSTGGGTGGGSTTQDTYGDTNIVVVSNYWPKQSDFAYSWSQQTVKAGSVFKYDDGKYYVVTKDTTLTKSQAAGVPGGTVYGWYNTQRLTGRVVTFAQGETQKKDLTRGDICQVGDDYYVFNDGGTYGYDPLSYPGQWYKIPR